MPNTTLYQTTQFDRYPPTQSHILLQSRERIINLRLHAQKIGIYNQIQADYYWDLSVQEEQKLKKWLQSNPPPTDHRSSLSKQHEKPLKKFFHLFAMKQHTV